jgi:hypothetical protein
LFAVDIFTTSSAVIRSTSPPDRASGEARHENAPQTIAAVLQNRGISCHASFPDLMGDGQFGRLESFFERGWPKVLTTLPLTPRSN